MVFLTAAILTGCENSNEASEGQSAGTTGTDLIASATPPPNTKEAQVLLRNWWVFEYYVVAGDRETSLANRGRWYKFSADGTFDTGQWQEDWGKGIWTLYYGGQFPVLHLITEDQEIIGEWEIQAISGDEETISLMGTGRYNQKGIAVKVINLLSKPTRKQFNME